MIKSKIIHLDHDPNNKLNCNCFTALRMRKILDIHDLAIIHHEKQYKVAKVIDVKILKVNELTPWHTLLDSNTKLADFMDFLLDDFDIEDIFSKKKIYLFLFESLSSWIRLPERSILFS